MSLCFDMVFIKVISFWSLIPFFVFFLFTFSSTFLHYDKPFNPESFFILPFCVVFLHPMCRFHCLSFSGEKKIEIRFDQVLRERLKVLHSKINARNERIKLLMQRGSPDLEPLDPLLETFS